VIVKTRRQPFRIFGFEEETFQPISEDEPRITTQSENDEAFKLAACDFAYGQPYGRALAGKAKRSSVAKSDCKQLGARKRS
jgi:hypothetical protein